MKKFPAAVGGKKLIVFDVDGTILNSLPFFIDVIIEYSRNNDLPPPCIETMSVGYGDAHNHDFKWGVSRDLQVEHLNNIWRLCDARALDHAPDLFHRAKDTLQGLHTEGHILAICTSKAEAPLQRVFAKHDIAPLFAARRVRDDIEKRGEQEKPAPDMLTSLMRELEFRPEDTVMIGDNTVDMKMARAAGTHAVGVTWGTCNAARLLDAGAHHILDDGCHHIPPLLRKIFT